MTSFLDRLSGTGIFARALRGSAIITGGYLVSQALRLASNLVLTRLLLPEAFGVMALVMVFLVGMAMFSDMGIGPSIVQNRRGDEPDFLHTAWTLQVIRGVVLWLGACVMALPAAWIYGLPELAWYLPVAGLALLISGFNPTRIETANRHLLQGRVTLLDVLGQVLTLLAMVGLAVLMRSVWALVIGNLLGAAIRLALCWAFLPGAPDRFRWDRTAVSELIRFGKWIFLSTVAGFLLAQGDKAILGLVLAVDRLGIYNIGYFLASFPFMLGVTLVGRIMVPIYREAAADPDGLGSRMRRMRFGLTGTILTLLFVMGVFGVPIVALLYDVRYVAAGAVVVAIACVQIPQVVGMTYDQSALAVGDSRSFFLVLALRVTVQTALFLAGAMLGGLPGALAGQGVAAVLTHGASIWLARRHGVWHALHDLIWGLAGAAMLAIILWLNWTELGVLVQF